jgi:hypothetical protein
VLVRSGFWKTGKSILADLFDENYNLIKEEDQIFRRSDLSLGNGKKMSQL